MDFVILPRIPSRSLLKNAISFFLREVISKAMPLESHPGPLVPPKAHNIRASATSVSYLKNYSIANVMEAAIYKYPFSVYFILSAGHPIFSQDGFDLAPYVAANSFVYSWILVYFVALYNGFSSCCFPLLLSCSFINIFNVTLIGHFLDSNNGEISQLFSFYD